MELALGPQQRAMEVMKQKFVEQVVSVGAVIGRRRKSRFDVAHLDACFLLVLRIVVFTEYGIEYNVMSHPSKLFRQFCCAKGSWSLLRISMIGYD